MKIIETDLLPEQLSSSEALWTYNGLDAMVTLEVLEALLPNLSNATEATYTFERDMQAPALDMMRRGIRVDFQERDRTVARLEQQLARLRHILDRIADAVWDAPLNPNSPAQLQSFFYKTLHISPVHIIDKGERRVSVNREALEKISQYFWGAFPSKLILSSREHSKKISVLKMGVDPDGRFRASFNVGATETGRWSSSENVYGGGTNAQNITEELRRIFVSDPLHMLAYADLEQAESRVVAYTSNCPAYIDACESGDPHTTAAMIIWPALKWSKDPKENREIAEAPFYRHFTYRDMAKRGGHASNYRATPFTISKHLKIPLHVAEQFQHAYFSAFPEIRTWHQRVAQQVQLYNKLTTALGRERHFYGRPNDDATLREAIAYEPQSVVGDVLNMGLLRVWKEIPEAQLLAQVHDAILYQFLANDFSVVEHVAKAMCIPVQFGKRTMTIPVETAVGYNWSKEDPKKRLHADGNPQGLRKYKEGMAHVKRAPEAAIMDFCVP